jgi:imidazolonepropionase-like amidohydrolase
MKRHFIFILFACLSTAPIFSQNVSFAFSHVTVIDMNSSKPKTDYTVIVQDEKISIVGKTGKIKIPSGIKIIDATGKYLIPGLWDMHIHCFNYENGKSNLPGLIAFGITGVRDMGTPLSDILRLRKETSEGKILSPRMYITGPLLETSLTGELANNKLLMSAGTKQEVEQAISVLKNAKVDFIKIDNSIPREAYFLIASETKKQNISFIGHLPYTISALEASIAHQKSIEHLGGGGADGILCSCSYKETQLNDSISKWTKNPFELDNIVFYKSSFTKLILDTYDTTKAKKLFYLFVKNKTWQTPTLVVLDSTWKWNSDRLNEIDKQYGIKIRQKQFELVKMMQQIGVGLLAGTDLPIDNPKLLDELEKLVLSGLTPYQALQTATINPAKFLNIENISGTIENGKFADLVLLDANPLENISNIRKIKAVVVNGKLFTDLELKQNSIKPSGR